MMAPAHTRMLAAGHQLGQYRILSALGAGGMGEVYLAEDTRLRRNVALKVLPPAAAEDERSQKRLIREAQSAATLDHPNICTVYDIGEADGQTFIAMQYIEGQTLAAALTRGPLELSSAIAIATQLAAALSEAHRHGVVHRDVKPQNIMLTASGQVKVLDFGLAKVSATAEHDAHTATLVTEVAAISGTIPYMSPEQVRGEPLDARTDVFSVGCVLYEMLGRVNPFVCRNAADTISAILTREPPPLSDATVPPELQRIVRKCLEKDRDRRYQSMRDLAIDLERAGREITRGVSQSLDAGSTPPQVRRWRAARGAAFAIAGVLIAAAGLGVYLYWRSTPPVGLSSADFVQITALPDSAAAPSLSPDGRMVAFIRGEWFLGTGQIYVKRLPDGDPVQLTNDPRPKYGPTFTPDGLRIAYTVIDEAGSSAMSWDTWAVPVTGGKPARMLPNAAGLTWIDDHHVLFSEIEAGTGIHMGVVTASDNRQDERPIYFPAKARAMAHYSYLSPDRRWVLVIEMDRTAAFLPCRLVPFDGSSTGRTVGPDGPCTAAAWSPDGRWMYFSASVDGVTHLWRQPFPDGAPEQITFAPATEERGIAMAPDGRSLITSVGHPQGSLWIHDAGGDRLLPLDGSVDAPRMSRDGRYVFCLVQRVGEPSALGLTKVDLDSGKTERMLTEFAIADFDISRDEQAAAFTAVDDRGNRHIWTAALDGRSPPRHLASDGDSVRFGRAAEFVYRSLTGTTNVLVRVGADGRGATRIFDRQVIESGEVSPDGEWAIVETPLPEDPSAGQTVAVPVHGGSPRRVCIGSCGVKWSPDGSAAYIPSIDSAGRLQMVRYPIRPGEVLPDLTPASSSEMPGRSDVAEWSRVAPGPNPSLYVFTRAERRGNLFRVPLR